MSTKSSYHHGNLHDALLAAGEEVLQERGLQGFTLRECARRADVSHAAPKHHFGDARGFLTAIAARGFERLVTGVQSALAEQPNGCSLADEFRTVTCAYLEFSLAWPEHFRIMFRSDLLNADDDILFGSSFRTFNELTNVVLRQRGEPELTDAHSVGDPKNASLVSDIVIAWSHVHGFAHLRLEGQFSMIAPDHEDDILDDVSTRLSNLIRGTIDK